MKKLLIISIILFISSSYIVYAQKKFIKIEEKENICFLYRWKNKFCKKTSPQKLHYCATIVPGVTLRPGLYVLEIYTEDYQLGMTTFALK